MNISNERKLAARAKELGESASSASFDELAELTRSESPLVRRLAASALGKLAGIIAPEPAVKTLQPLLSDTHPQVRQYTAKALGAFGVHAKDVLPDLRDLYKSPVEKDYVKRSVLAAGKTIREAVRIAEEQAVHCCRRCGVKLAAEGIQYRYDERFRILSGHAIRPDFYLPEFDVYVEYWGMDTADYKIGMLKKQQLYQQQGKKLISLYPDDKPRLREILVGKLEKLRQKSC
jgi:hypothetical protein